MRGVFRKLRAESIAAKKMKRYLLYAMGEIVLVVVGILIALQINNWNENQKRRAELKTVLENIVSDLDADSIEASILMGQMEFKIELSDSIVNGKISEEGLLSCPICFSMHQSFNDFILNNRGNEVLKSYLGRSGLGQDSLLNAISDFYFFQEMTFEQINKIIRDDVIETVKLHRDNIPGYSKFNLSGWSKEMARAYIEHGNFYNRLLFHGQLVQGNGLRALKAFQRQGGELKVGIRRRIKELAS